MQNDSKINLEIDKKTVHYKRIHDLAQPQVQGKRQTREIQANCEMAFLKKHWFFLFRENQCLDESGARSWE